MKETHSAKAAKTLELMGTVGSDWYHPAVKWVEEQRMMWVEVRCTTCGGGGRLYRDTAGNWLRDERGNSTPLTCPTCTSERSKFRGWGSGKMLAYKLAKVMIGYIQWPAGVRFNSRFGTNGRNCCELCSKTVKRSNLVPVATDKGNQAMWIGQDCASKFLNVRVYKPSKEELKAAKTTLSMLDENYESAS